MTLVATCVFLSGAGSLGLEVAWSRLLKLVFGSTTLAITTILVAYMLGLGLGGLFGGRVAARLRNGVRAYGWMEIAIGIYALLVPHVLAFYPSLNRSVASLEFWPAAMLRFALVLVVFLLPTLLMGATLPVLVSALVRESEHLTRRVGLLYGVNTLGAVAGVLGATFVGFRYLGLLGTNNLAAGLDILVGGLVLLAVAPKMADAESTATPAAAPFGPWNLAVATYGLVGMTALAYEVAWTRALAMVFGSSTYAFATMLAGFLAGIALGSLLARRWLARSERPQRLYATGVALLGVCALGVVFAFRALPDLFLAAFAQIGISGASLVWLGLAFSFLLMLAPTLVLGALFPLASRLALPPEGPGEGRGAAAVGAVYFVNSIGSAMGAFVAGFVTIPLLGLERTMGLAIAINFATAAVLFWRQSVRDRPDKRAALAAAAAIFAAVIVLVAPPSWNTHRLAVGAFYRSSTQLDFGLEEVPMEGAEVDELLFYEEGINATVSVHKPMAGLEEGGVSLRINGKTDASLGDMSTQVLSGHIPFLFGGMHAERGLIIGYASGVTTGSAAQYGLERIDVAEIEPAVIEASHWFDDYNHAPLERDDVRLILEDGRTYLSYTGETYDVIVSEPSNPWITGCANLFTTEFFEAARARLAPGGRLLQWIQLYGMGEDGLRSILAALQTSFPYAYGFLSDVHSGDLLLLATDTELGFEDLPVWERLPEAVRNDLSRIRIFSTADLWSLVHLLPEELSALAAEARTTNTDDSMFVELEAPWYLYDETPETLELLLSRTGGILPLLEDTDVDEATLGELAVSYLDRRDDEKLGDLVYETLGERWSEAHRAIYEVRRQVRNGRASPAELLELLDRSVRLAPGEFAPHFHRGWLLNQLGRFDDARAALEIALTLRPGQLEARHERMRGLAAVQRMREALGEGVFLIESPLIETEPRLLAEVAYLFGGFGRFDQAIETMRRYLELEPYSPEGWELLARWYELSEQPAMARGATANVANAHRNLIRQYHWLALWHERFGSRDDAVLALEEVLRIDPENDRARLDLERIRATT